MDGLMAGCLCAPMPTAALVAAFALAGASVPTLADRVLRKARSRYRSWTFEAAKSYAEFISKHGRKPEKNASADERMLWEWSNEAERLARSGMLSDEEVDAIERSGAGPPVIPDRNGLPTEKDLAAKFSFEGSAPCRLALALCMGTLSWHIASEHGISACTVAGTAFAGACLLMALVDLRSRTIPFSLTMAIAASTLSWLALTHDGTSFAQATVCAGVCWLALRLANLSASLRGKGRAIGGGDVKTMPWVVAAISPGGLAVAACAGCLALGVFLVRRLVEGRLDFEEAIPLGPLMAVMGIVGIAS